MSTLVALDLFWKTLKYIRHVDLGRPGFILENVEIYSYVLITFGVAETDRNLKYFLVLGKDIFILHG